MNIKNFVVVTLCFGFVWSISIFVAFGSEPAANPQIAITGVEDQKYYSEDVVPSIEITGSDIDNTKTLVLLNGAPFVPGTTIDQDGNYVLYAYAENLSGESAEESVNFVIDKTSPEVMINNPTDNSSIRGNIELQADIEDANKSDISVEIDDVKVSSTLPYSLNTKNYADGTHTISVSATDKAANITKEGVTVFIDNTKPKGFVTIKKNAVYTNKRQLYVNFQAADDGGITMIRMRNSGRDWSAWQTYKRAKEWTLANGNGKKTVYAQLKDKAGNISSTMSDRIILDRKKPTGCMKINKDSVYSNRRRVVLYLRGSDNYKLGHMRFKKADGKWSKWFSYKKTKEWTLKRDNGVNKVDAQIKDQAGNISKLIMDSIFLDNTPPSVSVKAPSSIITLLNNLNVKIEWSGSDALPSSGIDSFEVQYMVGQNGNWTTWLSRTEFGYGHFEASAGVTYYFRARAKDKAGNVGAWSESAKMSVLDYYGQFITEKTIVLIRSQQRIRIYDANGIMLRTFLVSTGKSYPTPGAYRVYSKSPQSQSMNGRVLLKWMVRFARASNGVRVGFHSVIYRRDGTVIDRDKLGQPVSHGCVRSDFPNAKFLYDFAPIGTKVWVVK